jgi:serine phosphatase RsbU (regulator of sigma subunit)/anti-sigma regulatory factor (Ser/Thr protein kinase)
MSPSTQTPELRSLKERVLVVLAAPGNQRLVTTMLAQRYDVVEDVADFDVDLCIVDGLSLHRHWDALREARSIQEPVLLPVLLISDRRDVGLITRDAWRVADDVLIRPVEQLEFAARVEAMLRARRMSLRLRRLSELYDHERRIARRLQDAALPHALPNIPGIAFDAFYRAGSDQAQIGGDWYDAVRLPDGRVVLSIGDVSGSGLDAAVTMASVRQILRGVAHVHADPAIMLDAADRTLQGDPSDPIVTAFVGVFDPVTSLLTYASAGHPRPLLRDECGAVRELRGDGLPLGVAGRLPRSAEVVEIPPGSLLVLYTDGLTEATHDLADGEQRLHAALANGAVLEAPNLAHAVHDAVLQDPARDDVAVFTVRRLGTDDEETPIVRWTFASDDVAAAQDVKHEFSRVLTAHGLSDDALAAAELLFAELLGNVVRYAGGMTEVAIDRSAPSPVLHVLDRGRGFRHMPKLPADVLSERGRGLYIVAALADDFTVSRRPDGGSHARAVLALEGMDRLVPALAFPDLDTIDATL